MGGLRVDLDGLARLADMTGDLGSRLGDLRDLDGSGVGHDGLVSALSGFTGRWGAAGRQQQGDVSQLSDRLTFAHQCYQQADADLAAGTSAMVQVGQ